MLSITLSSVETSLEARALWDKAEHQASTCDAEQYRLEARALAYVVGFSGAAQAATTEISSLLADVMDLRMAYVAGLRDALAPQDRIRPLVCV